MGVPLPLTKIGHFEPLEMSVDYVPVPMGKRWRIKNINMVVINQ
jgi:hypothetical protein